MTSETVAKSSKRQARVGHQQLVKRHPQECIFCGKILQNYFSLEMHMNSHTRERSWECSHCPASFMSYNVLIVHRNNLHFGKKFKCTGCSKVFNLPGMLYSHRKRAHPNHKFLRRNSSAKKKKQRRGKFKTMIVEREPVLNSVEEEEDGAPRQTVEIESNPGTPLVTVAVPSKDIEVVNKLKLPVIKIQRLPDGVWKQEIISEDDQVDTEPEEDNLSWSDHPPEVEEVSESPPLFSYPSDNLLPHQIPPLPPFNLVFPPFPFKLHNYNCSSDEPCYLDSPPPPLPTWDSSFFLHMNRYKPTDSCYHSGSSTPKSEGSQGDNTPPPSKPRPAPRRISKFVSKFSKKAPLSKATPPDGSPPPPPPKKKPLRKKKKRGAGGGGGAPPGQGKHSPNNSVGEDNEGLQKRQDLIDESETGLFSCKQCGKQFQIKWNLLTHLMTHTGEKPFACWFCKMRFRQKAHMIKHIASIHRYAGSPAAAQSKGKSTAPAADDFSCGFCGEPFSVKITLMKHISQVHSDKLQESV